MQFRGLQTRRWRDQLERELNRVGYRLGPWGDEALAEAIEIQPLGAGPVFELEVKHLQELGWFAELTRRDDGIPVADWKFDETQRYERSCCDVWIEWIADAVREASSDGSAS